MIPKNDLQMRAPQEDVAEPDLWSFVDFERKPAEDTREYLTSKNRRCAAVLSLV